MASPDRDRHHGGGGWDVDWEASMLRECPHCGAGQGTGHISYCPTLRDKPAPPTPPKMRCVREDEAPRDVLGGVALFFFGLIIGAGLGAWWMM